MKPYVVVTPGYNSFCGGIKVLHRLTHFLNEHGIPAYSTAGGTPPDWNVRFLKDLTPYEMKEIQQTGIAVYPDVVWGNPLKFNNCVQYDLQQMRPIQSNMLGVSLENCFGSKVKPDLTMMVIYMEDLFKLPEKEERRGTCYYKGKGKTECSDPDWLNIVNISREDLARLYQTSELLVCADNMTQTTVEARLCGCPVRMIEPGMLSWENYRNDNWGMNGIIINDDKTIEQAVLELPAFKQDYDERMKKNREEFLQFVEVTQNRQVDYIPLELAFHPGVFGISPEIMKIFGERG
ncbi:MAG: hypothetical protein GY853_01760 [PVC group bacterium]|nr:hypothetical protein [PVC group bacterium]